MSLANRRNRALARKKTLSAVLLVVCVVAIIIYVTSCGGSKNTAVHATRAVEINEVMSSNKGTLADETGDFPDWVELHNRTDKELDIGGYGLSDDLVSGVKWAFPAGTKLEADGYIVVFCSGEPSRGKLHAGFRISASDDVILTNATGSIIDSIGLKGVDSGLTLGRDPGNPDTFLTMSPSPGYPNTAEGQAAFLASQAVTADESIGVFINEFMPSNASTVVAPDGSYSDWIELYNTTGNTVDLSGCGISDNPAQPLRYTLPQGTSIEPYDVLLIYCTGRETPAGQAEVEAPFGLASYQESVVFSNPKGRILDVYDYSRADTDISFARQPDGTGEFSRCAQPTPGYTNTNAGLQAFQKMQSYGTGALEISEALNANYSTLKQPDQEYYDWIEIHNRSGEAVSLGGYALSNNAKNPAKWTFPDVTIDAGEYLVVMASGKNIADAQKKNELATNFRLSGDGEVVLLFSPEGQILDKLLVPKAHADVSYGRSSTGELMLFSTPTPNEPNGTGSPAYAEAPRFSLESGCYEGAQAVSIEVPEGTTVTYTLDGTDPTASSTPYVGGTIGIQKTSVLRARAFSSGLYDSDITSASYILYTGEDTMEHHRHTLPVMSIVTDPKNLFDPDTGIYVVGTTASEKGRAMDIDEDPNGFILAGTMNAKYAVTSNFWQKWERPVHFDLMDETGAREYSGDGIIRIFGAYSRNKEQKGLSLVARPGYGGSTFEHAFFDSRPYTSYKSVVLRASAQDSTFSRIRDIVITSLLGDHDLGLDGISRIHVQAYRQLVVYIDGQYWGVYNLREKITKHFLAQHYGVSDPDSIDILVGNGNELCVVNGNGWKDYTAMVEWADTHDMTSQANYDYICSLMDVENFAAYTAAEILVGNTDTGNIKYWRSKELDNKWRWLFYDFCWAMNRDDSKKSPSASVGYRRDFFTKYLHEQGHGTGKSTSTKLIRALLTNASFRAMFIEKVALLMNEVYTPEKINARIDECQGTIMEEMKYDVDRWDDINYNSWQQHCDNMRDYANHYQDWALKYCQEYFGLSDSDMTAIFGRKTSITE